MRASLDTNVIIHLNKAELQIVLFDVFDEGLADRKKWISSEILLLCHY